MVLLMWFIAIGGAILLAELNVNGPPRKIPEPWYSTYTLMSGAAYGLISYNSLTWFGAI